MKVVGGARRGGESTETKPLSALMSRQREQAGILALPHPGLPLGPGPCSSDSHLDVPGLLISRFCALPYQLKPLATVAMLNSVSVPLAKRQGNSEATRFSHESVLLEREEC